MSLSWNFNNLAHFYKVYRGTTNNFSVAPLLSGSVSSNSYQDSSAQEDASYFYFVEACNANGCSGASSGLEAAITSKPTNLIATKQGADIHLTWDANNLATSYTIKRNTTNNFATASLLSDSATSNSFVDTSSQIDTSYFYFVQACNANGCSDASNALETSVMSKPTNLVASRQGTSLSLAWSANKSCNQLQNLKKYCR